MVGRRSLAIGADAEEMTRGHAMKAGVAATRNRMQLRYPKAGNLNYASCSRAKMLDYTCVSTMHYCQR